MSCGCGSSSCSCFIVSGTGTIVTGAGSKADPIVIASTVTPPTSAALWNAPLPNDVDGLQSWNAELPEWAARRFLPGGGGEDDIFLLTNTTLFLMAQYVHTGFTSLGAAFYLGIGGVGASGHGFLGLYDSTGTLVAQTADLATPWASATGGTKFAWTAPAVLPVGRYWLGLLAYGWTTPPRMTGKLMYSAPNPYAFLSPSEYPTAINGTGHVSLPASITPATNTFRNVLQYCGLYG